jgi:hypothetical protein
MQGHEPLFISCPTASPGEPCRGSAALTASGEDAGQLQSTAAGEHPVVMRELSSVADVAGAQDPLRVQEACATLSGPGVLDPLLTPEESTGEKHQSPISTHTLVRTSRHLPGRLL